MQLSKNRPPEGGNRLYRVTLPTGAPPAAKGRPALVGVTGIEPVTSSLSGTRSNQLSYTPIALPTADG